MSLNKWIYRTQGKKWLILFLVLFINLLVLLGIVLSLQTYWDEINFFVGDFLGISINAVALLLLLIAIPIVYSGVLIIYNFKKLIQKEKIKPKLLHIIIALGIIALFNSVLVILLTLFPEGVALITSLIENLSIFLLLGVMIGLFIALYPIWGFIHRMWKQATRKGGNAKIKAVLITIYFSIGYGMGLLMPFLFAPVNVIRGDLPSKPKIIAHRGAAHLAPENTIVAGQVAVNFSVDGWEIDVQLSREGIPFLMHDDTLRRTTNVSEEFPGRENEPACNFTWAELQRLDAGSWFVERDPYKAIASGLVTPAQITLYQSAKIPSLAEAVNFTRDNGLLLDMDFKGVPSWHPNHTEYFNICLSYLKAGGIDEQIWIATGNINWLNTARAQTNMTTALSISIEDPLTTEEFLAMGYNMTNVNQGLPYEVVRAYVASGIPINMWTVDTVARFSQLWCLGISFITTNRPHEFVSLIQPNWFLHLDTYGLLWIVIYVLGLSFVVILKRDRPEDSR